MEGHCHPVVNTGKASDHSGATEEELVYTGPGSSCVPTHTNTHVMTLTVSLTAACLQVAAANLQLPTSTDNQSTGSSTSATLHQCSTTDWQWGRWGSCSPRLAVSHIRKETSNQSGRE